MSELDSLELANRLQRCMDDLPPLSPTISKVLQVVRRQEASPGDLVQVIKLDPVLTARVLRLINSPFFGMENVTSVSRAVVMLGFNTVKNLVLSSALAGILPQEERDASDEPWNHALAVGVSARALTRVMGMPRDEQEAAFIGGLMHDLGKILTTRFFAHEMQQCRVLQETGLSELDAEMQVLGTTHDVIGGMLARKWQFPSVLITSVEMHHNPPLEGPGWRESCITSLANGMYYHLGMGSGQDGASAMYLPTLWRVLGISEYDCSKALECIPEEIEAARIFLDR